MSTKNIESVIGILKDLFLKPEKFFSRYKERDILQMPGIYGVIFLYIMGIFFDRGEKIILVSSVIPIGVIVCIIIIFTIAYFYISSFFYNLRIYFCGGRKT